MPFSTLFFRFLVTSGLGAVVGVDVVDAAVETATLDAVAVMGVLVGGAVDAAVDAAAVVALVGTTGTATGGVCVPALKDA